METQKDQLWAELKTRVCEGAITSGVRMGRLWERMSRGALHSNLNVANDQKLIES